MQTYAEAARDPAVLARDMLQTAGAAADVPITGPAAKLSRTPLAVRSAAPALGAHNDEILDELGVRRAERARHVSPAEQRTRGVLSEIKRSRSRYDLAGRHDGTARNRTASIA